MKIFGRADFFVIAAIVLSALFALFYSVGAEKEDLFVEFYHQNRPVLRLPLSGEEEFVPPSLEEERRPDPSTGFSPATDESAVSVERRDGETTVKLAGAEVRLYRDGSVAFLHSNCPDQVCVHSGKISGDGQMLACVPNQLLVKIVSSAEPRLSASYTGYFDTVSSVLVEGMNESLFSEFSSELEREFARLHGLFSIYDDVFDEHGKAVVNLKYMNDHGKGDYLVDERLARLLVFARNAHDITGGRVNSYLGELLALWHEAREKREVPEIELLRKSVRYAEAGQVQIQKNRVIFSDRTRVDVGAVAKGMALDEVCEHLNKMYPEYSALLSMGGNIRAIGQSRDWKIGIQHPDGQGVFASFILPKGMAVATSGDYERYFEKDGTRYHHIIDPNTLFPADCGIRSVTVLSPSGAVSDMLTTALFMMSISEGLELAEKCDAEVFYITDDLRVITSSGFPEYQKR